MAAAAELANRDSSVAAAAELTNGGSSVAAAVELACRTSQLQTFVLWHVSSPNFEKMHSRPIRHVKVKVSVSPCRQSRRRCVSRARACVGLLLLGVFACVWVGFWRVWGSARLSPEEM